MISLKRMLSPSSRAIKKEIRFHNFSSFALIFVIGASGNKIKISALNVRRKYTCKKLMRMVKHLRRCSGTPRNRIGTKLQRGELRTSLSK
jgi:hypothetical protein